jgi:glutathione S-transferase
MLTLYHNDMSVCAAKVRVALAEKGIAWEGVHLNLRAGDTQKPDYLKLNPNGVVPTLVHDGRPLIESTVICEFIDDQWPEPPLKPADARSRATMRLWTKQLDEGLHAAVSTLSFCIAFRHQWLERTAEERANWLARMSQLERRQRSQANLEQGFSSPYFEPAVLRYIKLFDDFEAALAQTPWLAGAEFSLAEVNYAPYLARLRQLGFDALFERRPHVAAWAERVAAHPSVKEGVERWNNPKYLALFDERRPEAQAAIAKLMG